MFQSPACYFKFQRSGWVDRRNSCPADDVWPTTFDFMGGVFLSLCFLLVRQARVFHDGIFLIE